MEVTSIAKNEENCLILKGGARTNPSFLLEADNQVLEFEFAHLGLGYKFPENQRRIKLTLHSKDKLIPEVPLRAIKKSALITVNADEPKFAFPFLLTVNPIERTVRVKLESMPEFGISLITQDELDGISAAF